MHLNPNEAFVWLYILNIYGGFFGGAKMFFIFWHSNRDLQLQTLPSEHLQQKSDLFMWTGASGSFWKVLHWISFLIGNFLNTQSNLPETFKLAWAVFTHSDIHSHIQTAQVKANQSPVNLKCLSQRLNTILNQTEWREINGRRDNE